MINLLNLFFPKVCLACANHLSDNEQQICTVCRNELPVTDFHFNDDSTIKNLLYGRVKIKHGTALLHFSKKGLVQQLIHNLKYRGHESIGTLFGKWLGSELSELDAFKSVEVVVPVPLHSSKLRRRGYNQVAAFGRELAAALQAEYKDDVLIKTHSTKTQVFKSRLNRWSDDTSKFTLNDTSNLNGKHILLVDDIITTGATIEACANELFKINNLSLSVATMAITD